MSVDQLVAKASEIEDEKYIQQTLEGILYETLFPSQEVEITTILDLSRARSDGYVIGPHDGADLYRRAQTPANHS